LRAAVFLGDKCSVTARITFVGKPLKSKGARGDTLFLGALAFAVLLGLFAGLFDDI
jgi:hypothetical protein